jgi:hypothetical protein
MLGLFGGGTRKVESIATQVERQVESQRTRKGTQVGTLAALTALCRIVDCAVATQLLTHAALNELADKDSIGHGIVTWQARYSLVSQHSVDTLVT